jgi:nucleotide-binding universal stress UspA family protein
VIGSTEGKRAQEKTLSRAKEYLDGKGVDATYVEKLGPTGKVILEVARDNKVDIIAMGGYGSAPIVDVVAGSTVNHILREFDKPVLICR